MRTVEELIETAELAGTATRADVKAAEQEAHQAAAHVTALEKRIVDGDDTITPDELPKARELAEYAKLRAQAIKGKAERTVRAARLRACNQLRAEIEAYATDGSRQLADLLRKVQLAADAFTAAVEQRNATVRGWYQRMRPLEVPEHKSPVPMPPAEHAHLGISFKPGYGPALAAGRRRVPIAIQAQAQLEALIAALPVKDRDNRLAGLYDKLAQVDAEAPDVNPELRYFRSRTSGQVITLDAKALADADRSTSAVNNRVTASPYQRQIDNGDLVEISREEAYGS